ncbi:MAG: biotin transporter BioY [Candidatus Omnitrophota bacterium]
MELTLRREIILDKTACRVFGVVVFVILTALGAFVRIPLPFTPVPVTLQTLFVLLGALTLGRSLGALTQALYISLGILGAPVFSQTVLGLGFLAAPTAGYLFGFVLAAFFAGHLIPSARNNPFLILAVVLAADMIILVCGTLWLKFLFALPLNRALLIGFFPFIPGDLLKGLAVTSIFLKLESRLRAIF